MINNTIADSHAPNGGGIFSEKSSIQSYNNIIWGNTASNSEFGDQILLNGVNSDVKFYSNDIQGGKEAIAILNNNNNFDGIYDATNKMVNPEFVYDFELADPYSIKSISPCVNNGINKITGFIFPDNDLVGTQRNLNGIDIGAYEYDNGSGINDNIAYSWDLSQNYPNPFNPTTTINFTIPTDYNDLVKLSVYNVKGQEIAVLLNTQLKQGIHTISFDGSRLVSGIYYYSLKGKNFSKVMKMMMIK